MQRMIRITEVVVVISPTLLSAVLGITAVASGDRSGRRWRIGRRRRLSHRRRLGLVLRARRAPAFLCRRRLFGRRIALDDVGLRGLSQHADEGGPREVETELVLLQKGLD